MTVFYLYGKERSKFLLAFSLTLIGSQLNVKLESNPPIVCADPSYMAKFESEITSITGHGTVFLFYF